MAFHAGLNKVVLFGGTSSNTATPPAETWTWDGTTWTQLTPATQPSSRSQAAMVYDSSRQRLVLFGGVNVGTIARLNDTWEFDGTTWAQVVTANTPPIRASPGMAYDVRRQRVVLFGSTTSSDTWEYDGTNWLQRTPSAFPPPRSQTAMAWDPVNEVSVMFSGYDASPGMTSYTDTWTWSGSSWSRRTTTTNPSARWGHALVAAQDGLLLFGGSTATSMYVGDTWLWNGRAWVTRAPATSPPARYIHGMAFDSVRGRLVLFGGGGGTLHGDTWEYGP
jgi:hypothetical protein